MSKILLGNWNMNAVRSDHRQGESPVSLQCRGPFTPGHALTIDASTGDAVDSGSAIGGTAFTWKGAWSNTTAYAVGDAVSYSGSGYIAIAAGTGHQPDTSPSYWDVLVAKGANGTNGTDGKTVRNGSGAPGSSLGVDGDFYLDTTASRIYGPKTSGAWGSGVSLIGPAGTNGTNGANGANGTNGIDGKTVRNGSGAPASGLGVDGDFYIDTTNNRIYGPKTSGAWGSYTSLVGPAGPAGATGPSGTAGLTTKGDFLGYDTAPVRVPVGSDGQVLIADSSQAKGVRWGAVSGGGGVNPWWGNVMSMLLPPAVSAFSWVNQGSASASDATGGLLFNTPSTSSDARLLVKAAPSAPWIFTISLQFDWVPTNYTNATMVLRDSSTGKFITYGPTYNGGQKFQINRWNSATSFNATSVTVALQDPLMPFYFRIRNDGTNLIFSSGANLLRASANDLSAVQFTESKTAFLATIDQIGLMVHCNNGGSTVALFCHWEVR